MLKRLLTAVAPLFFAASLSFAVPAPLRWRSLIQPDGKSLTLRQTGDENFHYFCNTEGIPLLKRNDGVWVYAKVNQQQYVSTSHLVSTDIVAHDAEVRDAAEQAFVAQWISSQESEALSEIHAAQTTRRNASRMKKANRVKQRAIGSSVSPGAKRGLVILVNFKDTKMQAQYNKERFTAMMNQKGYNLDGHPGSVRDYFYDQSYQQLDLQFDVVGPVTMSKNHSYYGTNGADGDLHPGEMIAEACQLAKDSVDFSNYDWDGDGAVEQIYVIYAGYAEAQAESGEHTDWIWPHQWTLSESDYGRSLTLDGVLVNSYATSSELDSDSGTQLAPIGVLCHEFSHCLGLPDFYNTNSATGIFGMNAWSLMDYGCYNNGGVTPCAYTAYERMFCGWLTPKELNSPATVVGIAPITSRPEAYILRNDAHSDEYYILANHQQEKWDQYAAAKGLLIIHVDYDEDVWADNAVNNERNHQRCTIFAADNNLSASTLGGDLYPYGSKNALTNTSLPRASLFNANTDGQKLMSKPITNISMSGGLVSFDFMGGGTTTGISTPISLTQKANTTFDLSGRAVHGDASHRGLLIVNGKKQLRR